MRLAEKILISPQTKATRMKYIPRGMREKNTANVDCKIKMRQRITL